MKSFSELREKKGDPCWKGYTQVGMKKKDGKEVPNCVPKESVVQEKSTDKESPVYHIVTQGEGDNKQKVMAVYTDLKKAVAARDAWNKKNTVAKRSHQARVYSQKPFWNNKAPKVGSAISWSTYSNKDHYSKHKDLPVKKESVDLEEWQKETPWKKSPQQRKDKYGNVIKTKNIAKNLAKSAQKQTAKEESEVNELSIDKLRSYRKKAVDDVASGKKTDKRTAGVAKASNKIYRKEFDAQYKKESVDLGEAEQIDEISSKLARKAAAASKSRAYDYSSSVYDDESEKNADRLSNKANKAYAHVKKRQGQKGVDKTNRLANKLTFGKSRYSEEVELDEAKWVDDIRRIVDPRYSRRGAVINKMKKDRMAHISTVKQAVYVAMNDLQLQKRSEIEKFVKDKLGKGHEKETKDLLDKYEIKEETQLDEASYPLAKKWQSGAKMVKSGKLEFVRGSDGVHSIKMNGKSIGDFSLDDDAGMWVANLNGVRGQLTVDELDDLAKEIPKRVQKESVQHTFFSLREARRDAAKDLYFDTYSAAIQKAINTTFDKNKLEVDADDYYQKVNMGPGKPGRGKTTRHTLDLVDVKTGKPSRKKLHIQVYNRETDKKPFELNYYVS